MVARRKATTGAATTATASAVMHNQDDYEDFLSSIRKRFESLIGTGRPVFFTDAAGLFDAFLSALPEGATRQHYTCHACRRFVDGFGGLVAIEPDGAAVPLMWDAQGTPELYRPPVKALARLVGRAKVAGVFLSSEPKWGLPVTGEWHHMATVPPRGMVFKDTVLKNAGQASAEKLEEYRMLRRGLADFPLEMALQAHTLLTNGALYRSEKCVGVAKWFLDLHEALKAAPKGRRDNVAWLAVASAPVGFAHIRSSMIGTLLEDIAAGMEFGAIKRRFDEKMNPLAYQRPQAAPSAGSIAQAEKVITALESAGALERRFARLSDIQALWLPTPSKDEATKSGGVFSHLQPKGATPVFNASISAPPMVMTWAKFAASVLPKAERIEFFVPRGLASFVALVTASNPEAPPILQWDNEQKRNPVSWYLYHGGSSAQQWGLDAGVLRPVTAITLKPSMWSGEERHAHQGNGVIFVLDGARDLRSESAGNALFPETLRTEYHGIRSTIEAYSRAAKLAGRDEAEACGIALFAGREAWRDALVRTTDARNVQATYKLDRWD